MNTKTPIELADHKTKAVEQTNEPSETRLQDLAKLFLSRGVSQSNIDTTLRVLNIMSNVKSSNEDSITNKSDMNASQSFEDLKDLYELIEKIYLKEEKKEAKKPVGIKALYGIFQQLDRNIYFSTKNKVMSDDSSSSKHPSLYEAIMEHTSITKKQLNQQLKVMRMAKNRFPLLVFTPPKRGLIMIKNDVNDVPSRPNQKVLEPEDVEAFYATMKMLPRNTYFAIRPKSEPNLLKALNTVLSNATNSHEESEKMEIDQNNTQGKKMTQKDIRSIIPILKETPQVFPLIHFRRDGFKGTPWLMVKSDVNTIVVGGPKEEFEGRAIVTDSPEEANEILEARARSFYDGIILKLNVDEKYSHGPEKMFFKACKTIEPNLVFNTLNEFIIFFRKNKDKFPQLKSIVWKENEKDVRGFVVVSENAILEKLPLEVDDQDTEMVEEDNVMSINDTKARGGRGRELRMNLKRKEQLQARVDTLTKKLQALNRPERKGAKIQIRKHEIQQRMKNLKKKIHNLSENEEKIVSSEVDLVTN